MNDVAGYSPQDEVDWIVKDAKRTHDFIIEFNNTMISKTVLFK